MRIVQSNNGSAQKRCVIWFSADSGEYGLAGRKMKYDP